ncbi:MAG: aldehyde dehydrogenase family protein [Opitutaceae bacterium]
MTESSENHATVAEITSAIFRRLGVERDSPGVFNGEWFGSGAWLEKHSPIDGSLIGRVAQGSRTDYEAVIPRVQEAYATWRSLPAPRRGDVIRQFGNALRAVKKDLGALVSIESGKILAEGEGEVQEMIDICDFAVGLSRQLYGRTMPSERPGHRMMEQWHPLGLVGIISAFNFPVAVWAWNSALAAVCGDATVWKPSEKTPFTAIATIRLAEKTCRECGVDPALFSLIVGDGATVGTVLAADRRVPLISATGSTPMGRRVGRVVAERLGRSLLELGGNNAVIVTPSADLKLAARALFFGAVGTAGQRCTTTRRLIVHSTVRARLIDELAQAYQTLPIGNPMDPRTLMGPLIDVASVQAMMETIGEIEEGGGRVLWGGRRLSGAHYPGGCYVAPCVAEVGREREVVKRETFAPILYLIDYSEFEEAIAIHNEVPQGLSGAIFTRDLQEAERFLAAAGSDCGIANVNIGTSGAEIGGAFGGEKDTGGGRESGSDSWKAYMRRQTATVNYSDSLPLAQGIQFGGDA